LFPWKTFGNKLMGQLRKATVREMDTHAGRSQRAKGSRIDLQSPQSPHDARIKDEGGSGGDGVDWQTRGALMTKIDVFGGAIGASQRALDRCSLM
jgi:hypothetical protein